MKRRLAAVLALLTFGTHCGNQAQKPADAQIDDAPYVAVAQAGWSQATDDELLEFAGQVSRAIYGGDVAGFNQLVDWEAVIDRGIGGFEGLETQKRGFSKGVMQSLSGPTGMAPQLVTHAGQGGSFELLRLHDVDDEQRILFRFLDSEGGVNYYDMVVVKQPDGEIRAVDIYIFMTAEFVSKTLRRGFLPLAAEASKSFVERLSQSENQFLEHAGDIVEMHQSLVAGRPERALEIYGSLPAGLQRNKNVMLARLQAAMVTGDAEYEKTIEDFNRFYPGDPCVDLISIDGYIFKEQFDDALASIDRLDESVGGDPYLQVLRANIQLAMGSLQNAGQLADEAIAADGSLIDAYWVLVTISLEERDYDETVRMLDRLAQVFDLEFTDLTGIPEYAGFVKSEQYRRWLGHS